MRVTGCATQGHAKHYRGPHRCMEHKMSRFCSGITDTACDTACDTASCRAVQQLYLPFMENASSTSPMTAHGFVNGDGGPVAGSTGVTIQALKLHMGHTIAVVLIKASKAQHITQLHTRHSALPMAPAHTSMVRVRAFVAGQVRPPMSPLQACYWPQIICGPQHIRKGKKSGIGCT